MKKTALLLCILLLLSMLTPVVSAESADTLCIEGASVEATAGEMVQIPIDITANPGFMTLVLYYILPDGFTLESATNSTAELTFRHDKMSVWYGNKDYTSIGELATLSVCVPQTATAGIYEIKIVLYNDDCYNYDDEPVAVAIASAFITVASQTCAHTCSFDRFTGLYTCSLCGELCLHDLWDNGSCAYCRIKCSHEWATDGNNSICLNCGLECTTHTNLGLDFNCSVCGIDIGASNTLTEGNSYLYDAHMGIENIHSLECSFALVAGTNQTQLNTYNANKTDNIFYSTSASIPNENDCYGLFTWERTTERGEDEILPFCSLWLDDSTDTPMLYLVNSDDTEARVCEIIPGEAYDVTVSVVVKTGAYTVTVKNITHGTLNTFSGNITALTSPLTYSALRFGADYNTNRMCVQKISFLDVKVSSSEHSWNNNFCWLCAAECQHNFNRGGYCTLCGVLGDPITFNDGKNCGLTLDEGVIIKKAQNSAQYWEFKDIDGSLPGKNYVVKSTFNFKEYNIDATNGNELSQLLVWTDNNSSAKFGLVLRSGSGKLELCPITTDSSEILEQITLEPGVDYDIRVAIRSSELSQMGIYQQTAEVYVNGSFLWTKTFTLASTDGLSIRLGDCNDCATPESYTVKNDFGIYPIDSSIEYIGAQEKENANYYYDQKFTIRFVFGFDDIYLDDVGIKIEADVKNSTMFDYTHGEITASTNKSILQNIMVNGELCQPGVDGVGHGGSYIGLAINDITLDTTAEYTFTLTPYVKDNSLHSMNFMDYSYKITITFTDFKMNIDFEELS